MFTVTREIENPLLSPNEKHPWEAAATFNWCPVKESALTHVLYRALSLPDLVDGQHRSVSVIGHASSKDGIHFTGRKPFIVPEYDFEKYGCEDPRVTKLGSKYYIFYTALSNYPFNADGIRVAMAVTKDFKKIEKKALVTPFNAKAMALFPAKIGKKIAALVTVNTDKPPAEICYVEFDNEDQITDPEFWKNWYTRIHDFALPLRRRDGDQIELGSPPIKTTEGWLVFYSHIQRYGMPGTTFGIEAVLLDLNDPRRILGRTKGSIMSAETFYEKVGLVPNIIFPSGALVKGSGAKSVVELYYGGADTHCAIARIPLDQLLNAIIPDGSKTCLKRSPKNPILIPRKDINWEARGVLNPATIDLNGSVHILYRAVDTDNVSTIGYARSADGINIDERADKPIYIPRADFERRGCEDPRLSKIGERIFMVYTGYDGNRPRVAITSISESDFLAKQWNWSPPEVISPDYADDKDACILPEKIQNGTGAHGKEYLILHRVSNNICGDFVPTLDFSKQKIDKCIDILAPRPGMWDGWKVGISAPPIKTKKGWLLIYHGVSTTPTYRIGAALLDLDDPTTVIARASLPILEPIMPYEREGGPVHNVVFPCGMVVRGDTLYIYYGGADYCSNVATAKIDDILNMFE
ncbi:MAG: hypothetical protein KGJ35_01285 [Patescibacteria group bacterium]|nr:hypothetical protein [Patescibacteria group bacterium]